MLPSDFRPSTTPESNVQQTAVTNPAIKTGSVEANKNVRDDALALRYAPTLYFHPDETNFPVDPDAFLAQATLRQDGVDEPLAGPGELTTSAAGADSRWAVLIDDVGKDNSKAADGQVFLDHQDEELGKGIRAGDLDNSKLLYQYEKNTNTLTYFFFYAYNEGPQGVGDIQNHEGDWERITVQLDANDQPTEVRYSAHDGQGAVREWSDASENDHPVVYVAKGSHASLPGPGDWKTNAYGVLDEASKDGRRFDLAAQEPINVAEQAWYGSNINWGERGRLADIDTFGRFDNPLQYETSGPTGPSEGKGPIRFDTAEEYESALDRKPVDGGSIEGRVSDVLRSDALAWIGQVPDLYNDTAHFFTDTLPESLGNAYRAGEEFVTETVPEFAADTYRAGEEFVTETVPGFAVDTYRTGEEFVTETVPQAVADGWNAGEEFVGDRVSDGVELIDSVVPDKLPDIDLPDINLPDINLPDIDVPDINLPDVDLPDIPDPRDINWPG